MESFQENIVTEDYQLTSTFENGSSVDYKIILIQSEEGWAVSCPALRGCHSQGETREEAIENIQIAIREWLDAGDYRK